MTNQKRPNDDKLYCLLFDCVLYPLQLVKPCEWGNVSMIWLVSDANWSSNLWIHIEWLLTGRRMINSENHFRGYTAYFGKIFGQKWLFRLFLHSTYQSSRKSEICSAISPWRRQKRAAGRKQPFRRLASNKKICGGLPSCKPWYCSIWQLEAREHFWLCGNKAFFETMRWVIFFWTATYLIVVELQVFLEDWAMHATVEFKWLWLHIQKDAPVRDASAGVSLEEIQQRVFV